MRAATLRCGFALRLSLAGAVVWTLGPAAGAAIAADTVAEKPSAVAVTVYRAPERESGSINLDALGGFALITETRTVHLPEGLSRLRFEGVADGIEPASAIVTGLPEGVIEKNRDTKLLSPSALVSAALAKPVTLLRTDKKTGRQQRLAGTVLSDAQGGVVFKTSEGIEALRCSGLPETFIFTFAADLAARPTLSVQVRSSAAVTRTVTLSYLARGFDWAADYIATLSADGHTMDLGAWVTLANGNGVGFADADTQVVAGRVNHESGDVEPLDIGGAILAQCWPRGSTSDEPVMYMQLGGSARSMDRMYKMALAAPSPLAPDEAVVNGARRVMQEQLGDLKLYRMPDRTTVASRQSKQVRLMDRSGVPVRFVYGADIGADDEGSKKPAMLLLRTHNDAANHLGLPLPSGHVAVFASTQGTRLLQHESDIRDLAVNEEVEINMGESADVQVAVRAENSHIDPKQARSLPLVPGVNLRLAKAGEITRVEVSNARAAAIQFELQVSLPGGGRVVRADHPLGAKNGRPNFRFIVPANGTAALRFQTEITEGRVHTSALRFRGKVAAVPRAHGLHFTAW
ncbi:MAG: hypothetical protein ABJC66_10480 [Gammaproteobacteria bacterium]